MGSVRDRGRDYDRGRGIAEFVGFFWLSRLAGKCFISRDSSAGLGGSSIRLSMCETYVYLYYITDFGGALPFLVAWWSVC